MKHNEIVEILYIYTVPLPHTVLTINTTVTAIYVRKFVHIFTSRISFLSSVFLKFVKIWFIWKLIRLVVMVDPALSWKICFIRIRIRQALKHYLPCECLLCLVCLHLLPVVPLLVKLTTNRVIITPRGATKPSIIKKSLILQIFFKIQKHHFQINGKVGQLKKRKRVLCWSIYIYILLVPDNNTTIICFVPL